MKAFLIALGKAALYFLAFLVIQTAATFGGVFVSVIIDTVRSGVLPGADITLDGNFVPIVTVLSCLGSYLFFWLLFVIMKKKLSEEAGFARPGALMWDMSASISLGFGICILASFALTLIPFPASWVETYNNYAETLVGGNTYLVLFASVICAPLAEELVFRGLIYSRLKRGMPAFWASLVSAVLFGVAHGTPLHMFYTVPIGMILCLFYDKCKSLWAPILLHFAFNLASLVLSYYVIDSITRIAAFILIGIFLTLYGFLAPCGQKQNKTQ